MSTDRQPASEMEELVAHALERIEAEGVGALDELCRAHPENADELRARFDWLLETGLITAAGAPRDYPERLGDFRLIEPIGHGGMGVVYRAEQVSLGREVALKLVRPEQLYFPGALERFEREVTTVAGLAHPGIVPVFAVGQADGVPYFAMELVRGASLGTVIERLAERDVRELTGGDLLRALDELDVGSDEDASELFDGPWPTVCARVAREVAEALEHAHRRGVLHRDVKPSNVIVTRGGRIMLVDFGLASSAVVNERQTRTGQRVGTLAYMAPEQLRGERELDARTDVFALGVTLYELLALKLPHETGSEAERLARAHEVVLSGLNKLDPRITWELETIVQTATDPDPARRYASAGALASDLGLALEGKSIAARRASLWRRARRWAAREPARAVAVALVLALAAAGPIVARSMERQTERAAASLDDAIAAVDAMLEQSSNSDFIDSPGADPARRELLERAAELYERLLVREGKDPALLSGVVRANLRLSTIQCELGNLDESIAAAERALEATGGAELVERETLRWEARYSRALVLYARAEFEAFRAEAVAILAEPDAAADTTLSYRRAILWKLIALLRQSDRDFDGALEAIDRAIAVCEGLLESEPQDPVIHSELAMSLQTRSYFIAFRDRTADVDTGFSRAVELLDRTIDHDPKSPYQRYRLAHTLSRWAHVATMRDEMTQAESLAGEADEWFTELVREYPLREGYAVAYLANLQRLSWSLRRGGNAPAAAEVLERGLEAGQTILDRHSASDRAAFYFAMLAGELARIRGAEGRLDQADACWELARQGWERVLGAEMPRPAHEIQAGAFYGNLAKHQLARGRHDEAEASARSAIEWNQRMLERTGTADHQLRLDDATQLLEKILAERAGPD